MKAAIRTVSSDFAAPPRCVRDLIDAERYEASLLDFIGASWHTVEPMEFKRNWHIEAICDHLEACVDRQIQQLLINMPPRHMKSLAANVFFPAWAWAQNPNPENDSHYPYSIRRNSWRGPGVKFMHLSYERTLSTRDCVKCRHVIASPLYRRLWGHRFQLRADQNQKTRFDNSRGGHRLSTSEGGVITGEGADIIVFDDPHNVREIGGSSRSAREKTLRFWDEALASRLNDQNNGIFIVVMQRVHERDLSGHILANEQGWTHLCLPAVYEPKHPFPIRTTVKRRATGETWTDPRQEGEVLWPDKFPREALDRIAKDQSMSSHVAAGQLQQRPTAAEGGLFKRAWFDNRLELDRFAFAEGRRLELVRAWDLAWTTEISGSSPDYSVGVLMGRDPESHVCYILDVVRDRWSPAQLQHTIQAIAAIDGRECRIRIPRDPGAGNFVAAALAGHLQGYAVRTEQEHASKEQRAAPLAAEAENRTLVLHKADWNRAFVEELCAFPNGAHDDQVDAAAAAFRELTRRSQLYFVGA